MSLSIVGTDKAFDRHLDLMVDRHPMQNRKV